MIKSIRLQNWKSFADATLQVQPLTVLVGTNASGKSNLFEAFSFLKRFVSGVPFEDIFEEESNSFSIRGGSSWVIRRGAQKASLRVVLEHPTSKNGLVCYEVKFENDADLNLKIYSEEFSGKEDEAGKWKSLFRSKSIAEGHYKIDSKVGLADFIDTTGNVCILKVLSSFKGLNYPVKLFEYVVRQISESYFINPSPASMRQYAKIGEELRTDASNAAGVLVEHSKDKSNNVTERLNQFIQILPDFDLEKVYASAIAPINRDAMLFGVEKPNSNASKGFLVDAQTMSDGTLHFIGILTALLTVPKNSLVIMEEINQGLHPSRAKDLVNIIMEIIQEREIDVMFSTHDPALLDAVGLRFSENIQVVYRNDKGESGIKTLREFSGFAKLMGRGSLGTLSTRGELSELTFH